MTNNAFAEKSEYDFLMQEKTHSEKQHFVNVTCRVFLSLVHWLSYVTEKCSCFFH